MWDPLSLAWPASGICDGHYPEPDELSSEKGHSTPGCHLHSPPDFEEGSKTGLKLCIMLPSSDCIIFSSWEYNLLLHWHFIKEHTTLFAG